MEFTVQDADRGFIHVVRVLKQMINNHDSLLDKIPSRNGVSYRFAEPVTIKYENPRRHVMFNPYRNANPFFHIYEAIWMIAGRNDLVPLKRIVKQMAEFSDDGKTLNGAYGHRWRSGKCCIESGKEPTLKDSWKYQGTRKSVDQLKILIEHLKEQPYSRRAILQMWNVEDDLLNIGDGAPEYSKDVCCNLSVKFWLRDKETTTKNNREFRTHKRVLNMSVNNRSNDLVWGTFGANIVHFSFLHEYMAAALGVDVGTYYQKSDDLHIYDWNWEPGKWLNYLTEVYPDRYQKFINNVEVFDEEAKRFCDNLHMDTYTEPFLEFTAKPAMVAHQLYKCQGNSIQEVVNQAKKIERPDWRKACVEWLQRKVKS